MYSLFCDDISFCPIEKCRRKTCHRNQINIRDKTIPHSFFVERPPDCPYRKKQDDFYHVREKTADKRGQVIKEYADFVDSYISVCTSDDYQYKMHKAVLELLKRQQKEIETLKRYAYNVDVEALLKEDGSDG